MTVRLPRPPFAIASRSALEADIVFVARRDGLFDMVKHPRGLARSGLSRRERDAFAQARPDAVVEVRSEPLPLGHPDAPIPAAS